MDYHGSKLSRWPCCFYSTIGMMLTSWHHFKHFLWNLEIALMLSLLPCWFTTKSPRSVTLGRSASECDADLFMRSELRYKRPGPNPDSCSEDQTAIRFRNRVISCECLSLSFSLSLFIKWSQILFYMWCKLLSGTLMLHVYVWRSSSVKVDDHLPFILHVGCIETWYA